MKLIVGLGNPGAKFKDTRHNLGFMVADEFVRKQGLLWSYNPDWLGYVTKTPDYALIKPSTFMNKSGEAAKSVANFFKIETKDILAMHDELDLEFGKIKISFDSSAAGHNGVRSLIESLGGPDFARLRIGIGKPVGVDGEKYVLETFNEEEKQKLTGIISLGVGAIEAFLASGIEATMNAFNKQF